MIQQIPLKSVINGESEAGLAENLPRPFPLALLGVSFMVKSGIQPYAVWQQTLFWVAWGLLFVPGYFIWHGFSLLGSLVLAGYTDTVDWALLLIFGTALMELLLVAVYTLTHFWHQGYPFRRLLLWLMAGIAGIPLAATLGGIYAYVKLAM